MDNYEEQLEIHIKVLILTLWKGGYPHEVLSFLFNNCIGRGIHEPMVDSGSLEPNGTFWTPRKIAGELSEIPLARLCGILEERYLAESNLPESLVNVCFTRFLHSKVVEKVDDLIKFKDRSARRRWAGILDQLSGETVMADYFGRNPNASISDWIYKVRQNIRTTIQKEDWLNRPLDDLLERCVTPDDISGRLKRFIHIDFSGFKIFFLFFSFCREKLDLLV